MKIKVYQLTGKSLNYAAAHLTGMSWWTRSNAVWDRDGGYTDWILDSDGVLRQFYFDGSCSRAGAWVVHDIWEPTLNWNQGGPLMSDNRISRTIVHSGLWIAYIGFNYGDVKEHMQCDSSELVAGLRCAVASRFGEWFEIPDECLK